MAKEQLSPETTLKLRRTFQAPRERVFRAWTDPIELGRWFAPSEEYSAIVPVLELQVGGKYCVEMHHKGGNIHRVSGTYREIKPPEKIAFTWLWEHDPRRTNRSSPSNFATWARRRKSCSRTSICRTWNNAINTSTDGRVASTSSRII